MMPENRNAGRNSELSYERSVPKTRLKQELKRKAIEGRERIDQMGRKLGIWERFEEKKGKLWI